MHKTRFAPSPTGNLHIGNVRTALVAYLYIKSLSGEFILRIDDTDLERSKEEFITKIKHDLLSLNIIWDNTFHQSQRISRYQTIFENLQSCGRVYRCYETPLELETKRRALLKSGLPPIYDRSMLGISKNTIERFESSGRKPYFRFKLNENDIVTWKDLIHGEITVNLKNISDPIILRSNGLFTYMLPSAIDDLDYNITDIIRGDDHITNTAVQIQMLKAIEAKQIPNFAHLPLLKAAEEKISKRIGGYEVSAILEAGIEPMTICSYLASIGTTKSIIPYTEMNSLINDFSIRQFSTSSPTIDTDELLTLNHRLIQQISLNYIQSKFDIEEGFWNAIKENVFKLEEIESWKNICHGNIEPPLSEDSELISIALQSLPEEKIIDYSQWLGNIKKKVPKARNISLQLRLALTGSSYGPEMSKLLPFIEKNIIIKQLKKALALH